SPWRRIPPYRARQRCALRPALRHAATSDGGHGGPWASVTLAISGRCADSKPLVVAGNRPMPTKMRCRQRSSGGGPSKVRKFETEQGGCVLEVTDRHGPAISFLLVPCSC